jgi:hypothetical protein
MVPYAGRKKKRRLKKLNAAASFPFCKYNSMESHKGLVATKKVSGGLCFILSRIHLGLCRYKSQPECGQCGFGLPLANAGST